MSVPRSNTEVETMRRFRLRLSSLLWLVAIVAAFLAGIRYGEYRAAARRQSIVFFSPDGKIVRSLSEVEFGKVEVTKNTYTITHATGP
jgi:hypothetical protein